MESWLKVIAPTKGFPFLKHHFTPFSTNPPTATFALALFALVV
jgi:hypothetical protein